MSPLDIEPTWLQKGEKEKNKLAGGGRNRSRSIGQLNQSSFIQPIRSLDSQSGVAATLAALVVAV